MVAIVIGSGRGIRREMVCLLIAQGAKVMVNHLGGTPTAPAATVRSDGGRARVVENCSKAVASTVSIASMDGAQSIVDLAINRFWRIDRLFNNADIYNPTDIYATTEA